MKPRVLSILLLCAAALSLMSGCAPSGGSEAAARMTPSPAFGGEPDAPEPSSEPTSTPIPTPEPTPTSTPEPTPEPTPAYIFGEPVPESAPVPPEWFDDAALIGDSIMLSLQSYCADTHALGGAQFLCAGSLSATNALWEVSDASVHPVYNGVKMRLEDSVADCGAKNIYILLGTNNISFGVEAAASDMVTMIDRILEKSPDVNIIIQSVPPMTRTSTVWYDSLNNDRIDEYNEAMRLRCAERGWYFVNVGPSFKDADGNLSVNYCSDPTEMGIHFTTEAARLWAEYLLTHVPEPLK